MKTISKYIGYRTLKTAIGAALAVFIAQGIGLSYAVNAGIIVILSVQPTRKKSRDLAIMRIGSTVLALSIGTLVFSTVGFSAVAFGVYLLFFIPIASKLKFNDGIVPCSVLVSHLLASKSVAIDMLGNEMMQMLIGAGIGFISNYFMPSLEKQLDEDMATIDELIRKILKYMAESLRTQNTVLANELFDQLSSALKQGYSRALQDAENKMRKESTACIQYMEIRNRQYEILQYMRRYFKRLYKSYDQTHMVAALTEKVSEHLNDLIISDDVINRFKVSREVFKSMGLPATREEFENRATLYEYLNDLEHFLDVRSMVVGPLKSPDRAVLPSLN